MTRLLSIALLAATLSAQTYDGAIALPIPGLETRVYGLQTLDGQGALEAFLVPIDKQAQAHCHPHGGHSDCYLSRSHWYTSKKFWVPTLLIGSGVATGFLATRASHPPIGRPIMPAMPAPVTPVFGGVTFVGIGGPGVPVVTSKDGSN